VTAWDKEHAIEGDSSTVRGVTVPERDQTEPAMPGDGLDGAPGGQDGAEWPDIEWPDIGWPLPGDDEGRDADGEDGAPNGDGGSLPGDVPGDGSTGFPGGEFPGGGDAGWPAVPGSGESGGDGTEEPARAFGEPAG